MLSKNTIKYINSLKSGKFRQLHKQFIAEGPKLIEEFLNSSFHVTQIFGIPTARVFELQGKFTKTKFEGVSAKELERISGLKTPNEAIALIETPPPSLFPQTGFSDLILMLDEIKDPGNMGTIIRTADWFGIRHIVCSTDSVDIFNQKVVQATMGSLSRVNIFYTDLVSFLKKTPESIIVYGTLLNGENIYKKQLSKNGIIVIGNESKGISKKLLPFISDPLYIPNFPTTAKITAESLNASVATAIVCAEFRRVFSC